MLGKIGLGAVGLLVAGKILCHSETLPVMPGPVKTHWRGLRERRVAGATVGTWLALIGPTTALVVFLSPLIASLVTTNATVEADRATFGELRARIRELEDQTGEGERFTLRNGLNLGADIKTLCLEINRQRGSQQLNCITIGEIR